MCATIAIKGGDQIENCGQLRKLVGGENVAFAADMAGHEFADNECLCHVDVEATAKRSGYLCRRGWDTEFWADWVLEPGR